MMICVDDKAIVPVGSPQQPISAGVRGHNRSLVGLDGQMVALDHDWHVGGLIPSVLFMSDIPENAEESFYRGKVFETTKEKVFHPFFPSRHAAEIVNVLWPKHASRDDVNLDSPILLIFSHGGQDHRVTYTQVSS